MNTSIRWNASASRMITAVARPKWEAVRQGLTVVALAYVCLFALVVPGIFLVQLTHQDGRPEAFFGLGADAAHVLFWILGSTGTFLGYLLLLAGQWRCLSFAPQAHSAKEFAFACVLCSLMAPAALGAAYFVGGTESSQALQMGPAGLLLLAGAALGLSNVLLFSGFLRSVALCHGDEQRVRGIACFVWFAGFLVGSTAGLFLHAGSSFLTAAWAVLALGWWLSLLWHLVLILAASRSIQRALQRKRSTGAIAVVHNRGQVALRVPTLMHRREDAW